IRTAGPPSRDLAMTETVHRFLRPARYGGMSSRFVAAPFCELGPAGTDQAIGVFGGHLDNAIFSDRDASAREGLDRADPRWRLEANGDFRRFQFFGHFSIVL